MHELSRYSLLHQTPCSLGAEGENSSHVVYFYSGFEGLTVRENILAKLMSMEKAVKKKEEVMKVGSLLFRSQQQKHDTFRCVNYLIMWFEYN